MDAALIASLEHMASSLRITRYRAASTSDLEAATLYLWNIQLAEALYPSLATLEIVLRNAVHNTLTAKFGTDFWFQAVLAPQASLDVAKLIAKLT